MCSPWKIPWPDLLDGNACAKVTVGTSAAESFLMEKPLGNTLVGLLMHPSAFMSWEFGFSWETEILSILNSLTI